MADLVKLHQGEPKSRPARQRGRERSTITIVEKVPPEGVLDQYAQVINCEDRDGRGDHEVWIEREMPNGDNYFVPIPFSQWREFIRACQRLSTSE